MKVVRPAIVWFRNDLRLEDNPAFAAAVKTGAPVWPIFIYEEEGDWAPGGASRWWLHGALEDLEGQLADRGLTLTYFKGRPSEILPHLITAAHSVHAARGNTPVERAEEAQLPQSVLYYLSATIFAPAQIKPYKVFTPFYHYLLEQPWPSAMKPLGEDKITPSEPLARGLALKALGLRPKIAWDTGLAAAWNPTRKGGLERLAKIAAQQKDYHTARDVPALDGTSRLSPYLRWGQLSPREVVAACEREGEFVREVVWREFAYQLLHNHPQTPVQPLREAYVNFPWEPDKKLLAAWTKGRTGYPLVDAGMRQLWATGWMHNRVRMVVASFLVKHLLQPWQHGAVWFWDTLVDADLANNTFGWQWAAGCGADAAPYFRVFNPTLQLKKFDAQELYVKQWVPEYGTKNYPKPVVEHGAARAKALAALGKLKNL